MIALETLRELFLMYFIVPYLQFIFLFSFNKLMKTFERLQN